MVCIYDGIVFAIKKNEIMPFAARWMDFKITILSKSSRERKTCYHLYV